MTESVRRDAVSRGAIDDAILRRCGGGVGEKHESKTKEKINQSHFLHLHMVCKNVLRPISAPPIELREAWRASLAPSSPSPTWTASKRSDRYAPRLRACRDVGTRDAIRVATVRRCIAARLLHMLCSS